MIVYSLHELRNRVATAAPVRPFVACEVCGHSAEHQVVMRKDSGEIVVGGPRCVPDAVTDAPPYWGRPSHIEGYVEIVPAP